MTETAPPVRVPNVDPGAKSGLDHKIIGSAAHDAWAATNVTIPEGLHTVEGLLDWVRDANDSTLRLHRAEVVLAAENEKSEDDRRTTLVGPLETIIESTTGEDPAPAGADEDAPPPADAPVVPEGLEGPDLGAWITGDVEEGDEENNPERFDAFMARVRAVYDAEVAKPAEEQNDDLVEGLGEVLAARGIDPDATPDSSDPAEGAEQPSGS